MKRLREKLSLDAFCGYIVLLKKRYKESKDVDPSAQSTAMGNNNLVSKDPRFVIILNMQSFCCLPTSLLTCVLLLCPR